MFKALLVATIFALGYSVQQNIDVAKLNEKQKNIDKFFKDNIKSLEGKTLTSAVSQDKTYKYQYVGNDAPMTIIQANLKEDDKGNFVINEVIKSKKVPSEAGSLFNKAQVKSGGTFNDALKTLGWDK